MDDLLGVMCFLRGFCLVWWVVLLGVLGLYGVVAIMIAVDLLCVVGVMCLG